MLPPLDIFRVETDGHLLWRAAADTLQSAQRRIKILMTSEPADYVIYSQETGDKIFVSRESVTQSPASSSIDTGVGPE